MHRFALIAWLVGWLVGPVTETLTMMPWAKVQLAISTLVIGCAEPEHRMRGVIPECQTAPSSAMFREVLADVLGFNRKQPMDG